MHYVWVTPPDTVLPLGGRKVRVAVGTPRGPSSNCWGVSTHRRGDVYLFCRDNFQEVKASLHASGRWRFGLTADAVKERPDLVSSGSDRVWEKWERPVVFGDKPIVAFRIMIPPAGLYLSAAQRSDWKPAVFSEPPEDTNMMTVLSVCVIPKISDFDFGSLAGGRLAILQLDGSLDVHVVATHHKDTTSTILEAARKTLINDVDYFAEVSQHPDGVHLLYGEGDDGVRFVLPFPSRKLISA